VRKEMEKEMRAAFTANRHKQKHSADELLRLQVADKVAANKYSPPSTELKPGKIPSAERVEQHLLGAVSFYKCLQQDDGHFSGTTSDVTVSVKACAACRAPSLVGEPTVGGPVSHSSNPQHQQQV
jgi:hypothetical protein